LRTYRIHLGSANILMEPDNSYLCIVPARGTGDGKVFLPFEDDTKITDPTILAQLGRRA
jgi:hypothetical protein